MLVLELKRGKPLRFILEDGRAVTLYTKRQRTEGGTRFAIDAPRTIRIDRDPPPKPTESERPIQRRQAIAEAETHAPASL